MSVIRNLADLSSTELEEFLNSFDNVFCDCDGVIWVEPNKAVPGVKETLAKLKEMGKIIRFVSNNNTRGMKEFYKKFQDFEYDDVTENDIAYPTLAMVDYLKSINFDKQIFLMGCSIMKKEITEAGFKLAEIEADTIEENITAIIEAFKDNLDVGAVIIDFDLSVNYAKLLKATVYLKRPDVLFLKGGTDKKFYISEKSFLIGPGCFQSITEELSDRVAMNFGKPSLNFNEYLKRRFKIDNPHRTLFIGDFIDQDMEFASKCGYKKLLTFTGVSRREDLEKCTNENLLPDFCIDSLGNLHKLLDKKS